MNVETALERYIEKRGLNSVKEFYQSKGLNINPKVLSIEKVEAYEVPTFKFHVSPSYIPYQAFENVIKDFFKMIYPNRRISIIFNGTSYSYWP